MAVDVYNIFYLNGMDWINLNWIAESSKVATPFWGKVCLYWRIVKEND